MNARFKWFLTKGVTKNPLQYQERPSKKTKIVSQSLDEVLLRRLFYLKRLVALFIFEM